MWSEGLGAIILIPIQRRGEGRRQHVHVAVAVEVERVDASFPCVGSMDFTPGGVAERLGPVVLVPVDHPIPRITFLHLFQIRHKDIDIAVGVQVGRVGGVRRGPPFKAERRADDLRRAEARGRRAVVPVPRHGVRPVLLVCRVSHEQVHVAVLVDVDGLRANRKVPRRRADGRGRRRATLIFAPSPAWTFT